MDPRAFVESLSEENDKALAGLKSPLSIPLRDHAFQIIPMLRLALKNEVEAADIAALWMSTTPEIDAKMGFGRQVGDESRHYKLIEQRLRELGQNVEALNPLEKGYSSLFTFLAGLKTTIERVAAGQFTREAIAIIKNGQFIDLCKQQGDAETAKLYEEIIQPDETYHHQLGRLILEKYARTEDDQEKARAAARRTLELAEELQDLLLRKTGAHHAPGC